MFCLRVLMERFWMSNDRVIQNTGYQREELIGQNHRIFSSGYHEPQFYENMWNTIKSGNIWRDEVCNRKKMGIHIGWILQ